MKTFEFRVTQPADTYFIGTIEIEAKTEQKAFEKANKMSNDEIDELVDGNWITADEAIPCGNIEVHPNID